jgi:hypothetical protein
MLICIQYLENFRKKSQIQNLQKHIQILVREFKIQNREKEKNQYQKK